MASRAITGSSERWSRRCCCEGAASLGGQAEYAQFLKDLFVQRNAGRRERLNTTELLCDKRPLEDIPERLYWNVFCDFICIARLGRVG